MGGGVDGTTREHVTCPSVRSADFDQLMREDTGITTGESIGLRDRCGARFDGPSFELWRKVSAIKQGDRETRRRLTPFRRIKADGEIFPRPERRPPFPDPQPTLARPSHATE